MTPEELARKAAALLASPVSLLLAVLFFLPWLQIQCGGVRLASASGLDLTVGRVSPNERLHQASEDRQPSAQEFSEDPTRSRPWFLLGFLLPLAGLIISVLRLGGRISLKCLGVGLMVVAAGGLAMILLATEVEYDEIKNQMMKESPQQVQPEPSPETDPQEQMGQELADGMGQGMAQVAATMITTRATAFLWVSLALYVLVLLCGVWSLVASVLFPARRRVSGMSQEYNPTHA